ncbi:hypothetical protein T265_05280 [Opisthorchis viverrini]|uniref:Uncharacterized protein n=1 Tax=Opisthorchis viverrini TaxID=6198 RepID=A0A074ZWK8_OPIVI|nr:hypothetical protein T265_05280 [Opisthorchis viverrini]KER27720.1 hypothetical protein T265_05280 [Opisthorchis viverrini]
MFQEDLNQRTETLPKEQNSQCRSMNPSTEYGRYVWKIFEDPPCLTVDANVASRALVYALDSIDPQLPILLPWKLTIEGLQHAAIDFLIRLLMLLAMRFSSDQPIGCISWSII